MAISIISLSPDAWNSSNFIEELCMTNRRIFFNVELLRPYLAMFGFYLGHGLAITSSLLFLDTWNCSNFHCKACIPKRRILSNVVIVTIFWLFLAMFWLYLKYICFYMPHMAQIFTEVSYMPNRQTICWIIKIISWPCLVPNRILFWHFIPKLYI